MKKCTKCGEVKPLEDYRKGHASCRNCEKESARIYRINNADKVKAAKRAINDKIKEANANRISKCHFCGNDFKLTRSDKKYCSEKCADKMSAIRNKKSIAKQQKRYRHNNREKLRLQKAQYQKETWEARYAKMRDWFKKNKDEQMPKRAELLRTARKYLNDWYIRQVLAMQFNFDINSIPPDLIELKKMEIKIKRLLKTKKDENTETS